jgi:oxygen-independent coproporphyrinogen-3 oxidase
MYKNFAKGTLNRNFMGYTTTNTRLLIGLGMSSISDSWYGFAQNEKVLENYYKLLENNELPVVKGHILNEEDLIIRQHILNIMCRFETNWTDNLYFEDLPQVLQSLKELQKDGLIHLFADKLIVTEKGKTFIRNICMAFDLRLMRNKPERQLFSMTV